MLSPANTDHDSRSCGDHCAFLRRAAEDPRFRASLEADAQAALAEYGLSVDPEMIPTKVTIPSAESILDLNDEASNPDQRRPDGGLAPWVPLFGTVAGK